jgi:Asp-tRNA(Asn)/Glu-tRNA(Gln) amidotransferase A subunit family amidase
MKRILLVVVVALVATPASAQKLEIVEATIPEMQAALKARRITSRELVLRHLARIATYEDRLNAVLAVNPKALEEADRLDRERAQGRVRGPLHGIPIALKDNIQTTDVPTTGGALAFEGLVPPYEATVTRNLRDAGAIVIAKTGMTELANWVAGPPTPMSGGYNSLGGQGYNPYDPRRDPRPDTADGRPALFVGGSSSGIGTAASFWAANVGTETSGSILSPANANMLAAVKPTVGRVSRHGIIPITADQDTAGPMARTVTDAAILLGAIEGPDANDATTSRCPRERDYTKYLARDGLRGARIGIPRAFFYDEITPPGADKPRGGLNPDQKKVMEEAIAVLRREGAVVVDPVDIPSVVDRDPEGNALLWGVCTSMDDLKAHRLLDRLRLRHGTRLQPLARVARRKSAGEVVDRAPPLEPRAPEARHAQVRAVTPGPLGCHGSGDLPRPLPGGSRQGPRPQRHAWHRRRDADPPPRCAALSRAERRPARRPARLSDGDRALRDGAERAHPALPRRIRRPAGAVRRELHRDGVQRADAAPAGVRLRAGDEAQGPAAPVPLTRGASPKEVTRRV